MVLTCLKLLQIQKRGRNDSLKLLKYNFVHLVCPVVLFTLFTFLTTMTSVFQMIPWVKSEKIPTVTKLLSYFTTHLFNTTCVNASLRWLILCVLTVKYLTNSCMTLAMTIEVTVIFNHRLLKGRTGYSAARGFELGSENEIGFIS